PNDINLAEQVIGSASSMRPGIAPDLIAPLAAKLKKMVRPPLFVREGEATVRSLFIVLCAWLKPFGFNDDEADSAFEELARIVSSKPGSAEINLGLEVILLRRAFCLADRVSKGKTAALLSLPSHTGGWIDPKRLVKRSRFWTETGEAMIPEDQIVALLRLAPDGRGDALKAAAGIDGEWGKALRYALGGDEAFGESVALWVAAARARDPSGDDLKVEEKWPGLGAGGGKAGRISTTVSWSSSEYEGKTYHHYDFLAAVNPQGALAVDQNLPLRQRAMRGKIWRGKSDLALLPTVMAHDLPDCPGLSGYFRHPLVTDWALSVWPSYPDFSYTAAALMIGRYDGEPRNVSDPLPAGYKLVLDPDVPLTETGITMICRALNDSDPGDQQSGGDALAQTIEDGRLDAAGFGSELHRLLLTGIILPKRSAPRLREVADISPLHRLTICKALEHAMRGGVPLRPFRDLHAWLDLLLELLTETGEAIEDEMTKAFLKSLSGSSKAAKTARKLLAQKTGDTERIRDAAILYAIEMRLHRAERWI
ncbi:MAG TPA: DUF6493 family protein, partial [Afifellaceae bacterium]|nr:DUF6493 family protein [Afifellaceae bacterium]